VMAEIEGLKIHAVHKRSSRPDAVPLLILHGWPSSCFEFLGIFDALTEPRDASTAFHVIAPSIPGYGFSTTRRGIGPQDIARMFVILMTDLGYAKFMVQGGDWGSLIGTEICRIAPERVIGLHLNCVNGSPPAEPDPAALSQPEQIWASESGKFLSNPHFVQLTREPDSLAYALNDSPAGLAAWIAAKFHDWVDADVVTGDDHVFDAVVRTVAIYWFTRTIGSSSRLYFEMVCKPPVERYVVVPTAGAIFPAEMVKLPRAWAQQHYNIVQWSVFDRGGHFPALEVPDLLIADIRGFAALLNASGRAK